MLLYTDTAKALVLYGWMTLLAQVLASCCLHAHIVDLVTTTASIQMTWLFPAVLVSIHYDVLVPQCTIMIIKNLMIIDQSCKMWMQKKSPTTCDCLK